MGKLEGKVGFFKVIETAIKYFDPEKSPVDDGKPKLAPENSKSEIERIGKEIQELAKSIEDVAEDKRKIESDCAFLKNLFSNFDSSEKQAKTKTNQLMDRLKERDQEVSELYQKVTKIKRDEQNVEIALQRINSRNSLDDIFDASINEIIVGTPMSLKHYTSMDKLQTSIQEKEQKFERALARIAKLEQEIHVKSMQIEEINAKMSLESLEKKRLIMQNKHLFDEKHKLAAKAVDKSVEDKTKANLFRSRTVIMRK